MDLSYYLNILWRRKWLLFGIPMLVMLVVYLVVASLPKSYKARAIMATGITEQSEGNPLGGYVYMQPFEVNTKFANLIELLRSQPLSTAVGYELLLHDLESKSKAFRTPNKELAVDEGTMIALLRRKLQAENVLSANASTEDMLYRTLKSYGYDSYSISQSTSVTRVPESDYLRIEFSSENPQLSAFAVNKATEVLMTIRNQVSLSNNNNLLEYLRRLAERKRLEMEAKVEELKNYKMKNKVINLYEQTKALVDQQKDIEIAREQERKNLSGLRRNIKDIETRFTPRKRQYLEALAGDFNRRMEEYRRKIGENQDKFVESNMKDSSYLKTAENLRREFDQLVKTHHEAFLLNPNNTKQELVSRQLNSELDLEIAKNATASLDAESNRLEEKVNSYTPHEATIYKLEREIETNMQAYLVILNKLNDLQFGSLNFYKALKTIEKGVAPEHPESNRIWLYVVIAGLAALLLVALTILAIDYFDESVRTVSGFERETGVRPVAGLNMIPSGSFDLGRVFREEQRDGSLEMFKNQVRSLRTQIEQDPDSKVYVLTDFSGQSGKTTVAVSLAYALGLTGKRVLLADANFRNNELTRLFQAPELINNGMNSLVLPNNTTEVTKRIDVAGTGRSNMTPSEIMPDYAWRSLFDRWRRDYDYILVECRSLLQHNDTEELMPYADKVIAIYPSHSVISKADLRNIGNLQEYGVKFGGVVLNQIRNDNMGDIVGDVSQYSNNGGTPWYSRVFRNRSNQDTFQENQNYNNNNNRNNNTSAGSGTSISFSRNSD
jgi:Mrp family chromosome partitioning ATPase/uncharacterized protein involved in exopolysaccharide biosynthesis